MVLQEGRMEGWWSGKRIPREENRGNKSMEVQGETTTSGGTAFMKGGGKRWA